MKKVFSYLLIIVIFIMAGIFYYNNFLRKTDIFSKITDTINKTADFDKNVASLSKNNNGKMYWNTSDGYLIVTPDSQQLILKYQCNLGSGDDMRSFVSLLIKNITTVLDQNGFKRSDIKNDLNKTDWLSKKTEFVSDNYLSEKANLYCNLSVDLGCNKLVTDSTFHNTLSFTCSSKENYSKNYADQSKILQDLNIKGAALSKISDYQGYILFNAHPEWGSGFHLVTKQINDKWTKLFAGQDYPFCLTVDQYKIPHQLGGELTECVNSKGELVDNSN